MWELVLAVATDPITGGLLQYGAIGIVACIALLGVKVLYGRVAEAERLERARADRLEQELRQLNEVIRNQYVDTIARATAAIVAAIDAVEALRNEEIRPGSHRRN